MDKDLLLKTAARLYSIGMEVDAAKERLRQMVEAGVSYDSKEMRNALQEYQTLAASWRNLEQQYLEMKQKL